MEKWQQPETFVIWLAIAIGVMLAFVAAILVISRLYFLRVLTLEREQALARLRHQEALAKNGILVLERERTRVSMELHDGLISRLNTLMLTSAMEKGLLQAEAVLPALSQCIEETRRISHDLTPPLLKESSLGTLIQEHTARLQGMFVVDQYINDRYGADLPVESKLHLIRIFQEAVNNIIRHAQAKRIYVNLRMTPSWVVLKIVDNGVGFVQGTEKAGLGLQGIVLRVQIMGGHYRFRSRHGRGTSILIVLGTKNER